MSRNYGRAGLNGRRAAADAAELRGRVQELLAALGLWVAPKALRAEQRGAAYLVVSAHPRKPDAVAAGAAQDLGVRVAVLSGALLPLPPGNIAPDLLDALVCILAEAAATLREAAEDARAASDLKTDVSGTEEVAG